MAVLFYIRKLEEQVDEVTYAYGPDRDADLGTVTVQKSTFQPVSDGSVLPPAALDGNARRALAALAAGKRKSGTWPERYAYQA